ncbi:MAG: hypothetical protein Kow0070_20850 [Anaerolineales bacterium]
MKWLQSKVGKVLYGVLLALMLTMLLGLFPQNALAACTGNGCVGKDPTEQGCGTGAQTKKWIYIPNNVYPGLGQAQLRFSSTCNAKWARTLNTSGFWYYTAATDWWYFSPPFGYSYSGGTFPNETVYTKMLGPAYSAQACGAMNTSPISVPLPMNNSWYCTGWW